MCVQCIFLFPSISHLGVLDRGYHWTGRYFPGITALVFPVYISQTMFTLVLLLGVSVLDVLEYLIGENQGLSQACVIAL